MKFLVILSVLSPFKIVLNVLYYAAAIGIIFFMLKLLKKRKDKLPVRTEFKMLIICGAIAFITLIFKIFV
jgi:hypothetical protein